VTGSTGKLYFNKIQALNLAFVAYNQINQVFVQNCAFYGSWTQTGMNAIISNTFFINQNPIVINGIHNGDNFRTSFTAFGGAADGTLSAIFTPNIGTNDNAVVVNLNSFPVDGGITIDGANDPNAVVVPFLSATSDSIVGTVTLLNSAPFPVYLNAATAVAYNPSTPANWTILPKTIAEALDLIAAHIAPV